MRRHQAVGVFGECQRAQSVSLGERRGEKGRIMQGPESQAENFRLNLKSLRKIDIIYFFWWQRDESL